jgi:hypothetical protein
LQPPKWLKREWLANPGSTDLFQKFAKNAPRMFAANTTTVQGFYCMTGDGEYLAGDFANTFRDQAENLMRTALTRFDQIAARRGWKKRPIPQNRFELTMDEKVAAGGIKLEVAVRDLPRKKTRPQGNEAWYNDAYNVSWVDFSPNEARQFVPTQAAQLPRSILEKLSFKYMKDFVRGQAGDFKKGALQSGELHSTPIREDGDLRTNRIYGYVILRQANHVFAGQIHGQATYNDATRQFDSFELVAVGQRQGAHGANARQNDRGPAPMGTSFRLYKSK